MKTIKPITVLIAFFIGLIINEVKSQTDSTNTDYVKDEISIIITYNGGEFIGGIIKQDDKEVTIETKDRGEITIPKYEIKEIRTLDEGEISLKGEYKSGEVFSTRYFLTTNGLPMKKGDSYVLWHIFGPEVQFGVAKNFSLGIMTTWIGSPIVGSAKYSIKLAKDVHVGIGALAGTISWIAPDMGLALPYGALTFGNDRINLNLSAGYGMAFYDGKSSGSGLYSIGFMSKITNKVSFILDSFFFTYERNNGYYNYSTNTYVQKVEKKVAGIVTPGIRIQTRSNSSFQFGFSGAFDQDNLAPFLIPMVGWFKKL